MTEPMYRLELTDRELGLLLGAVATLASIVRLESETMARCDAMAARLRAIEPIGTIGDSGTEAG